MADIIRRSGISWPLVLVLGLLVALLPGAVHAVTWGPVVADLSDAGQDAADPHVAVSTDGSHATAIWYRSNGAEDIIQSRFATIAGDTATWGPVTDLSATGGWAEYPGVALSADGTRATAVWDRWDGSNSIVQARSATISGGIATWGPVTDLSDAGQNAQTAQIGLSADGTRATVVWNRSDGSHEITQSASAIITGNTATWGQVTDLSAAGQAAREPQVGVSADGTRATAVWYREDGSNSIVQSTSATITGNAATWGQVTDLSEAGQNASGQRIALSADGSRATAVWYRSDGSNDIVQSTSATITGNAATWGQVTDLSEAGRNADTPRVGVSDDGTSATAIWVRFDGIEEVTQSRSAAISGTAATWGPVTNLSTAGHRGNGPQVAVWSDGTGATAVWTQLGDGNIIQSRSASITGSTATWGPATDLSDPISGRAQVAVSADGRHATSVWERNDGTDVIIQARSGAALPQTITFPAPADTRVDQGPVALSATASSGLPVSFTADTPTVCTVSGSSVTLVATGTCTITAHQAGDVTYAPAPDVARSFAVTPVPGPGPGPTPTPVKPGKPTGVKATSKGGKVTLKWAAPKTPVTGYLIQFSTNKKKWKKAGTAGPTAKKFVWKKGKKGKKYYLRLRASSSAGNGPWSKPVKVKVR